MLTKRQNMLEVIHGGNPDRFVKQYEGLTFVLEYSISDEVSYDAGRTWCTNSKMRMGIL